MSSIRFLLVLLVLVSVTTSSVFARSGCCSHHGGVCGCGCCDGSSLSSTCAPYYPECSEQTPTPTYAPVYTPISTATPYPTYTPLSTAVPTAPVTVLETKNINSDDSGGLVTLALLGGLGFGGYKLAKHLLGKS